jgi:hypothetical protein
MASDCALIIAVLVRPARLGAYKDVVPKLEDFIPNKDKGKDYPNWKCSICFI